MVLVACEVCVLLVRIYLYLVAVNRAVHAGGNDAETTRKQPKNDLKKGRKHTVSTMFLPLVFVAFSWPFSPAFSCRFCLRELP